MSRFTLFLFVFVTLGKPMTAWGEPFQDIKRLRELADKTQINPQELQEAKKILDSLRRRTSRGDQDVTATLFEIVESGKCKIMRPLALPVLCEKADSKAAQRIVQMVAREVRLLREVGSVTKIDRANVPSVPLISPFIDQGAPQIVTTLEDVRPLFDLLVEFMACDRIMFRADLPQKAERLIAAADVDIAIRKEYALKLIKAKPHYPPPDGFERLFGPEDIATLRKLVRAPNNTPTTFCWGAANILAHLGDEGAIPDVRAFILKHPIGTLPPEEQVKGYTFRIELQHPPTKLLDFIRGGVWNGWSRVWAMERALDYEIDKAKIREAILEHAQKHVDDHPNLRFEIYSLKQRAIELGVLRPNDLPEVKAPPRQKVTP